MTYNDIRKSITCSVWCYSNGRYTIKEALQRIINDIDNYTFYIYDIDKRISTQSRLYKQGMHQLTKAIEKMERQN